jgi:hypothetical protein
MPPHSPNARTRRARGSAWSGRRSARLVGDDPHAEHAALQKKLATDQGASRRWRRTSGRSARNCCRRAFVEATPFERLAHFPRYLKAASLRIDKLRADPARDARLAQEFAALYKPWERERLARRKSGAPDPWLEDFRWMMEELRVALFAQELKTPMPVSVKTPAEGLGKPAAALAPVIPAKAGIHDLAKCLDSRFRGNDEGTE